MSPPKLLDFPPEAHEAPELEVMLAGCATDPERKAVREAFHTFSQGDPGAFSIQLAVLLTAHARALKAAPDAFNKAVANTFSEVNDTVVSHRLAVKEAQAALSKDVATLGQQAALAKGDLGQLREELSKCSEALQKIFAGIIDERRAFQAAAQALESISERRIVMGLVSAFAAGVASCGVAVWIWRALCGGF